MGNFYLLVDPFCAIRVQEWLYAHEWEEHYKAELDFARGLEKDGQHV